MGRFELPHSNSLNLGSITQILNVRLRKPNRYGDAFVSDKYIFALYGGVSPS